MLTSRSAPVRIGVVGLGRFGRLHALTLSGLREAELAAVVARRPASLDALKAELPNVPRYTNLDEAAAAGIEAWVVACTTSAHVPIARQLLERGACVLLEKPIADSLAEARSLEPLVRRDSSNLMIGHIVLFNSEFRALQAECRRRGEIRFIDCVRHRPATIINDFPGENPLHAAMVHDLYMTQALLNFEQPCRFSAQFRRTETGAVDVALAQLAFPSGALACFTASYLTPPGMPPRGIDRLELFGAGWSAKLDPNPRPLVVYDEQARWPLALEISTGSSADAGVSGPTGMMAEELRAFCRVVRGDQPVPQGAAYFDALQVQDWMDRLERSAAN